jgi:undecaprenyl-diphosphatase
VTGIPERPDGVFRPEERRALLISLWWTLVFLSLVSALFFHGTASVDRSVAEIFSGLPSAVYVFFSIFCRSGNVEIELPVLFALGWTLWKRRPETGRVLLFFAGVLVIGTVLEHLLKMHLPRYSPPAPFRHDTLPGWAVFFPVHFHVIASFPSGHTFRALLILLMVRLFYPSAFLPVLLWATGIIVGVVVLGWHWSSDAAGSVALVGAVWPWAGFLFRRIKKS